MVGNTTPYQIRVDFLQIWDLFQNKHMFDAVNENEGNSDLHHIAEMTYAEHSVQVQQVCN